MITYLDHLDRELLLAVNGLHTSYLDQAMWLTSSRLSWVLILIAFLLTLRNKGWRQAAVAIAAVALTVLLADQVASGLIKHAVERLRPTHEPELAGMVHLVKGYTGGRFGFVSSHAANSFGVAMVVGLTMRSRRALWALMAWAAVQCYSRMYMGVHYPGDIVGGMVVGLLAGWLVYKLWHYAQRRWMHTGGHVFAEADGTLIAQAVTETIIVIAIMALCMPSVL